MRNSIEGQTFALYGCKAWTDGDNQETTISGLYMVEEVVYSDRTCGQWESGVTVFDPALAPDAPMFFVDEWTFMEQTQPKTVGNMIRDEREAEFAAEKFDREFGDLFGAGVQ